MARRVFGLFVLCALVPLAALAYLSLSQITAHLEASSRHRLRETAKAAGMTIFERLSSLDLEVEGLASRARQLAAGDLSFVDALWRERLLGRFGGVALVAEDGRTLASFGDAQTGPLPSGPAREHLLAGKTLAKVGEGAASPGTVVLVRAADPRLPARGFLWGTVRPDYLWGGDSVMSPATGLLVLDASGALLASSLPGPPPLTELRDARKTAALSGHFTWDVGDDAYLASYWTLFMEPRFGTSWIVVHGQSRSDVTAPMKRFRALFLLTALLTLLVVLLLSLSQIRRSLVPLERLHDATRRIRRRELGARVRIDGEDEFSDLGASFNEMAESLETHLRDLETLNRIGTALTTERESGGLLKLILKGAKDVTRADAAALYLGESRAARLGLSLMLIDSLGLELHGSDPESVPLRLPGDLPNTSHAAARSTLANATVNVADASGEDDAELPGNRLFDARHGYRSRSILAVPLRDERGEPFGVLQLMNAREPASDEPVPFSSAAQELAESLASQAAVALAQNRLTSALEESERRYRDLIAHSPGAIWIHDLDGTMQFVNPACAQGLGYEPEEVLGRNLEHFLADPTRADFRGYLTRVADSGAADTALTVVTKTGEERVWTCRSVRYETPDRPPFVIGHGQDVTDRERINERLRQAQKLQAVGTLAGGIAHDFNNLLTPILAYADMALDEVDPVGKTHEKLGKILGAAERARDLVQQVLSFSRNQDQGRKPLSLTPLVKEVQRLIRASLPSTIEMVTETEGATGKVAADPVQIHQVLMNLCTNAGHAMAQTGGVLRIRLDDVEVDRPFAEARPGLHPGPYTRLAIQDTGCGMSPQVAERAFEPFFTTKGPGEGTGLGLAVVHGIVTDHGGAVVLTTSPGEGTTFEIYFPQSSEGETETSYGEHAAMPRGDGQRILFVDDEPMISKLGQELLERLGYQVEATTGANQALARLRTDPARFDLIITDQIMPGLTGTGLALEARRLRPGVPIILCTGNTHTLDAAGAEEAGIDAVLQKPFAARAVAEVVDRVLTRQTGSRGNGAAETEAVAGPASL